MRGWKHKGFARFKCLPLDIQRRKASVLYERQNPLCTQTESYLIVWNLRCPRSRPEQYHFAVRGLVVFKQKWNKSIYNDDYEGSLCQQSLNEEVGIFSAANFLKIPDENENFATGMDIAEDEKFAIFFLEDNVTNSRQIVSYALRDSGE